MSPIGDRISSLPDELLCHILSFLLTREAVVTSVISKRWRHLWPLVSTLHFNDRRYWQNKTTYLNFYKLVYTVMLLRDGVKVQPIQKFYLECESSLCNSSILNTWIMAATRRKVEHLSLSLPSLVELPSCILTCRTLVVLKLIGLKVKSVSSVVLPLLKTLHLTWTELKRRDLFEILLACPALEDVLISRLQLTSIPRYGQLKTLPKLVKADLDGATDNIPLTGFNNVEFLRINIYVPLPIVNGIGTFLNLTRLELIFPSYEWGWLFQLLFSCLSLRVLVTGKGKGEGGSKKSEGNWLCPKSVPKCLSSKLKRCCIRTYEGQNGELQFAKYIMQNARVLGTLKICSANSLNPEAKLRMIKKLSLCPRISTDSVLFFE